MQKNLLQDMVKIKYKRERTDSALGAVQTGSKALKNQPKSRTRYTLWLVAIISVIFFLFALSYLFFKAEVAVNPKMKDIVLNENLSASKNGSAETIPFDLIVISGGENKIIQTTEERDISEKARGVVLIYNAFSSVAQRLDIDTRLLGSNNKIYKTEKQVFVPGMKNNIPGSIEVGIYGAEGGEEYNSGPLDFTIVGFKGTPKYSKFYARSNIEDTATTGKIEGGFKGKFPFISDKEKTSVINELNTILQAKLFKKATNQIPSGLVLFKDAIFLNTDSNDINPVSSKDKTLSIKLKGTLYGFIFDKEKLIKKIAENNIKEYDGSPIFIPNIQNLIFSMPNGQAGLSDKKNASFRNVENINFNLSGATKIVWKLDEDKLRTDLLGKSKKDFSQILLQYPNVVSADLVLSPFWKISLPDKAKDRKVIVNYPK